MQANIGLATKNLRQVTAVLSAVLSEAIVLYTKTRRFHWNVSGNSFGEQLFEKQYKILEKSIDEIAERINRLGSKTPATMQEILEMTSLSESPGHYRSQEEMIYELLKDHEEVIVHLRKLIDDWDEKYGDIGTADFLTDLLKQHETIAWTLRRYPTNGE